MDLSNGEGMKGCGSTKKLKTNSDENKDYLSDLPDSILMHILSFLPIGDAIKTVFLRRFGNLWRNTSVLDLNECLYHHHICGSIAYNEYGAIHNEKFVGFIRNVLDHHETATLDKLRLKMCFVSCFLDYDDDDPDLMNYYDREESTDELVKELISYGISRKVEVLDLNFRGCFRLNERSETYYLPDVLRSDYLGELRLFGCNLGGLTLDFGTEDISLKSLRVLIMQEVVLVDETMEKIFLGCPFLEDLSLVQPKWDPYNSYDCLEKLSCSNPNLKKMMLTFSEKLTISCPYLLTLDIAGPIEHDVFLDVSSVVDASISFNGSIRCEQTAYVEVRKVLHKFRLCTTFTPCNWTILVMARWNKKNVPCPSFNWKNLILKLSLTKWHHPGISLLLRSCLFLETLTMYIYPPCDYNDVFQIEKSKWIQDHDFDFDGESYWDSQEATFPHLKSIVICGYINEPYVIQMVKFLLRSAVNLRKMVISTKGSFEPTHDSEMFIDAMKKQKNHFNSEQLLELSNKLLCFPRSSSKAVIFFS